MPEVVVGFSKRVPRAVQAMGLAAFAAASLAVAARQDEESAAREGVASANRLDRRFIAAWSHRATENLVSFDGQRQPSVELTGSLWDVTAEVERRFVDTVRRRDEGGAVLAFERVIARAGGERRHTAYEYDPGQGVGEYFPLPVVVTSPLEGARVAFERPEVGAPFTARLVAGGDEDRLAELSPDADLAAWRVPPDAELGRRWTVPAAALGEILRAGGSLALEDDYARERQHRIDDAALWAEALDAWSGEIAVEVVSLRQEAGGRIAAARLEGEPRAGVRWPAERFADARGTDARDDAPVRAGSEGALDIQFSLAGELLWHLDEDRAVALDAAGPYEARVTVESSIERASRARAVSITTVLAGEWRLAARIERPE